MNKKDKMGRIKKSYKRKNAPEDPWKWHNDLMKRVHNTIMGKRRIPWSRKYFILFNLDEAFHTYFHLFEYILDNPKWKPDLMAADMHEIYYHTNIAWNARNAKLRDIRKYEDKDHKKWVKFPKDIGAGVFIEGRPKRK